MRIKTSYLEKISKSTLRSQNLSDKILVTVNNGKQNVLSVPETDERRASQLDETGKAKYVTASEDLY